jgi:hypothetical protein
MLREEDYIILFTLPSSKALIKEIFKQISNS